MLKVYVSLMFIGLSVIYYGINFNYNIDYAVFLTIATFLFSIFTGFFISRQGKRYSNIRDQQAIFNGEMNSIYRHFNYLGDKIQNEVKKIIRAHYKIILEKKHGIITLYINLLP